MSRIINPDNIARRLNAGEVVKIDNIPTFTHEVSGLTFVAPVVVRCAQSGRWNAIAKVVKDDNGDRVYVKDNTLVGNDKTAKIGVYRIDKIADKENQATWRANRARLIEEAQAIIEAGVVEGDDVDEDDNEDEEAAA